MISRFRSILCTPVSMHSHTKQGDFCADGLLFDLEDSIPANKKEEGRSLLSGKLCEARKTHPRITLFTRINSVRTHEGIQDLIRIVSDGVCPDIIQLPKVETTDEIRFVKWLLLHNYPGVRIQLIIETAKGLASLSGLLQDTEGLDGIVFGAADFSTDIDCELNWDTLAVYRTELVKAGRMHRLHVIDSPYFDCSDIYGLRQEAALSAKMGFTGKMAIHPSQIVEINDAFLPTKEKIDWARQIVIEASKQTSAIFKINGKMIGPPIVEGARRLIEYHNSFCNRGVKWKE